MRAKRVGACIASTLFRDLLLLFIYYMLSPIWQHGYICPRLSEKIFNENAGLAITVPVPLATPIIRASL